MSSRSTRQAEGTSGEAQELDSKQVIVEIDDEGVPRCAAGGGLSTLVALGAVIRRYET